uniref:NodB homology domain-containing protein n=1 Tax=candidate division WOR-3 bacterium TaxID=2052148 RepID=A0A7C4YAH8_UNCW3
MLLKIKSNKKLWEIFTRKEEYETLILDRHKRFSYFLSKYKDIFNPSVSRYLVKKGLLKIEYPEKKGFAVCLTHDIDILRYKFSEKVKILLKGFKSLKFNPKILLSDLKRFNPLMNFEKIIETEKKFNAKSTFFFLSLRKDDFEFNYEIKRLKREIRFIIDNGFEIGLQGGYDTFIDKERMIKEKNLLEDVAGKEVIGYRNHYLRFKIPETWENLKEAGFEYDSTLSYPHCVGFKNGMCHPFKPFNLNTDKFIDIFEIPLNIMDETIFTYMTFEPEDAWDILKTIIDKTEENNGVLTILWHNTNLSGERLKLYERILDYCFRKNAWITSCENIWKFFIRIF